MKPVLDETSSRVMLEALRQTTNKTMVELGEIASAAKVAVSTAGRVLSRVESLPLGKQLSFTPNVRLHLAIEIARGGRLKDAAKVLSWQEFEKFTEECLKEAGFEARRNVRVTGEGRAWQIDVVGLRGELALAIDCKHWNTPGYVSRFKQAANHQRHATSHLLTAMKVESAEGVIGSQALAVILTLREPPAQVTERALLVSVERLPSFLSGVTPYDENLPFISSSVAVVENPMSQFE